MFAVYLTFFIPIPFNKWGKNNSVVMKKHTFKHIFFAYLFIQLPDSLKAYINKQNVTLPNIFSSTDVTTLDSLSCGKKVLSKRPSTHLLTLNSLSLDCTSKSVKSKTKTKNITNIVGT